jgi:hypothetical protein
MEGSISSKEEIASIDFCALLLTAIVVFLTRSTPVERLFRFILVFADDTHAYRQLLNTGYHEKVRIYYSIGLLVGRLAHRVLAMGNLKGLLYLNIEYY